MSNLSSTVLASGIRLVDKLDSLRSPFQDFSRPCQPKRGVMPNLRQLASHFEWDMENFAIRGGTIYQYRLPTTGPLDLGDQALMHGIYTFMWAVRNHVEPDPKIEAIVSLCLEGLADQQHCGILARGIDEDGRVQWDASNDQATGHLLGLWGVWQYGTQEQKDLARRLIYEWASYILDHGHAMVNPDGKVTQYGQLIQGILTDPLRLTLCLAIYRTAHRMTEEDKFLRAFSALYAQYESLIQFPKVRLWSWDTQYDSHRAAIHLMILSTPFTSHDGLTRLRSMLSKDANPWINALCALSIGMNDNDTHIAKTVLSEMTLEDQMYNDPKINSTDPAIEKVMWGGQWCARQPIPLWKRSADDFPWQRNRFAIDQRRERDSRYNGGGYLAAFWASRLVGILEVGD